MKPSVRAGLGFQAIASMRLHRERGSRAENPSLGATDTPAGRRAPDRAENGLIGELGCGPQLASQQAAVDGIAGQPTLTTPELPFNNF